MISSQTKIIIIVVSTLLLGIGLVWESWSTYITLKTQPTIEEQALGIVELQGAVKLWKEKKPFSLDSIELQATDAATIDKKPDAIDALAVQIRDASGKDSIEKIKSDLTVISEIEIVKESIVSTEKSTKIARKTAVPRAITDALREVIGSSFSSVEVTTLSREASVDIVITLGSN